MRSIQEDAGMFGFEMDLLQAFLFFSFPVSYCTRTYLDPHLIAIMKLVCRPETLSSTFIARFEVREDIRDGRNGRALRGIN